MSDNRSSIEDGEIVSSITKREKKQQNSNTRIEKERRKHTRNISKSTINQYESSYDSEFSDEYENTSVADLYSKSEKYEYSYKKTRKHKYDYSSEIKTLIASAQFHTRRVGLQNAMNKLDEVCLHLKSAMKKLDKIRRLMKFDNKDIRKDPDCVEQAECIFGGIRSVHVVNNFSICRNYDPYLVKDLMKVAMNYRHLLFSSLQKKELEDWYENCNVPNQDRAIENRERHRRSVNQRYTFHDNVMSSKRYYHTDPHYQRYMRSCYNNKPFIHHKSISRSPYRIMMPGSRPKMQISSFEDRNLLRQRSDFEQHAGNRNIHQNVEFENNQELNLCTNNRNGQQHQQFNNNSSSVSKEFSCSNSKGQQQSKSPNIHIDSISESMSKINISLSLSQSEEEQKENKQHYHHMKSIIEDKNIINEDSKPHLLECCENDIIKDVESNDKYKEEWNLDSFTDKNEISVKERNILSSEMPWQKMQESNEMSSNIPDKIIATTTSNIKAPNQQLNSIITKNEIIEPNSTLKPMIQPNPKFIMNYNENMHFPQANTHINKKPKIEDNKYNINTTEYKHNIYLNCPSYINTYSSTTKIPNIIEQSMIHQHPPIPLAPLPPQYYCYINTNYETIPESYYIPDYQMSEHASEPMDMRMDDEIEYKAVSPESITAFEDANLKLNESLDEACSETSVVTDPEDLDSNFILKESQISPDIEIKIDMKKFDEKIYDIEIPKIFPDNIAIVNKEMLKNGYLILIMDLDIFISVIEFNQCTNEEMTFLEGLLKNEEKRNVKNRTLYKMEERAMWIKFRPGFKNFMKYATQAFKIYFKSSRIKSEVINVISVIDIDKEIYMDDKLIFDNKNEAFSIPEHLLLNMPYLFIVDHTTSYHKNDQMVLRIAPYFFFKSTKLLFGLKTKTLLDYKMDENRKEGYMMSTMETLLKMRKKLFKCLKYYPHEFIENLPSWDARTVISQTKLHLFKGLNFVFSRIYTPDELPQNHWLWLMAIHHGAHCQLDCSDKVTHVIATTKDTRKVRWGVANNKYVITPTWLEISCTLMYRLDEKLYSLI